MSKSLNLFGGAAVGTVAVLGLALASADGFVTQMPNSLAKLTPVPVQAAQTVAASETAPAPAVVATAPVAQPLLGVVSPAEADEATPVKYGLGRAALPEEVAAWDLDVSPDGTGLPQGSGDALTGEPLFEDNCASCHGSFAEGVDNWPKLAGGEGTLADDDPLKTVGSYWPHVSTVWDYVHRSMPFGNAQSLSHDEVYAIVAYILYSNDLIADDFVLDQDSLPAFELPNTAGFVIDDRAEAEYSIWRGEPCMQDCKDGEVQITMRATVLDVTPEETAAKAAQQAEVSAPAAAETAETVVATAETAAPAEAAVAEAAVAVAAIDMALAAQGEKVFGKCKSCHQVGEGAKNRSGPHLNGVVGRAIGSVDGFRYSGVMSEMGGVWDEATLAAFLANPRGAVKGTKMSFAGLKSEDDIAAVTEYLKTYAE